jgi:ABC-type transport system involved in multi-copper enzyme maturation permease subunit
VFVAALFALAAASWQLLVGSQQIVNLGDLAWFGAAVFQILAPLQLAVAMPFATLLVAASVALEKDRKTLELLLMSRLSNSELVLGKLFASLLIVIVVLLAAIPLLLSVSLLGGISAAQIVRSQAVTLAAVLAAGSLGSLIALWREKTFQSLAISTLVLVLWVAAWEGISTGVFGASLWGVPVETWAIIVSPWKAVQEAARPRFAAGANPLLFDPVNQNVICSLAIAAMLNGWAIFRVRVWNPVREARSSQVEPAGAGAVTAFPNVAARGNVHSSGGRVRNVWDNPILWREVRTWTFGKKVLIIRAAYLTIFGLCAAAVVVAGATPPVGESASTIPPAAAPLAVLMVVSLILLNALAVTSLTNERDSRALDLLLVTDLSPREFVIGKLGGAFYNAKEMVVLPAALCLYLWFDTRLTTENLLFVLAGWALMCMFSAALGLHAGITYTNSRAAIATSIGTLLFLFLGIATCMRIMLAFSAFEYQFPAFVGFIAGGMLGMYVALNWRYRSVALNIVAFVTPPATFFVITSYLLGHYGAVFVVTALTYGFAIAAMLVPAVTEFDIALGDAPAQED